MVNLRDYTSIQDRRIAIEKLLKVKLPHIASFSINEEVQVGNIENMIGAVQIPLGLAGPLIIDYKNKKSEYFIPLATTEGALVASISRGAKAINESGGVNIFVKRIGISRAPVFVVNNYEHGLKVIEFVEEKFELLKKTTESTSMHLKLKKIKPYQIGRNLFLRFVYDTGEAMGMNMATIATAAAAKLIESKTNAKCIALSGNMCVDKKANYLNFIEGRGFSVTAESTIPEDIVRKILKTTPDTLLEVFERKIHNGSILSGSIGANAQAANVLAAIFAATGQDLGHIAESASCVTSIEKLKDGSIYVSVFLPDLPVGVVGGGTTIETQKEALQVLGVGSSKGSSEKLAGVIGAAVACGELSLLASLAERALADTHKKLGRRKK